MDWNDPEQVRAYYRAYQLKNRDRIREVKRKYREANKKKIRKYMTKYKQDNKEEQQAYHRAYRLKNRDRIIKYTLEYYHKNIEKMRKIKKEWNKNNPASVLQHIANRRARKKRAIPAWLRNCPVEKRRVYTVYLLSRIYAKADGIERHVDHMWPLSDGGPHWSGNLQILTKTQNLEKGTYSCPKLKKQMKLNLKEARALHVKAA